MPNANESETASDDSEDEENVDLYNSSQDDSEDEEKVDLYNSSEVESEAEESSSEESDEASVEESDTNDKTSKEIKKKNASQPQDKIKWKKKGRNWTTLNEFVDHDEKLQLNMPEDTLTRFSSSIEFSRLFFTKDLSEIIFDETKLYDE